MIEEDDVPVGMIATNPAWQVRAKPDAGAIERYAAAYRAGKPLPPLEAVRQREALLIVDGWHRLEAAKRAGLTRVPVTVLELSPDEAAWRAAEANLSHGVPLKRGEHRSVFRAFVRAGKHRNGRRLQSYRDIERALGGIRRHTTIRNWMKQDFPAVAAKMQDDERTGCLGAGPSWKQSPYGPEQAAQAHLESILVILKGLPAERRKAFAEPLREAFEEALRDHADEPF